MIFTNITYLVARGLSLHSRSLLALSAIVGETDTIRSLVPEPGHLHLQAQHQNDGHRADRGDRRLAHEVRDLVPQEETERHVHAAVRERGH